MGVGPGDPRMMTLMAVDTIKSCDVIAAPDTGGAENVALNIARGFIDAQEIVKYPAPMTRDKARLDAAHRATAADIYARLLRGQNIAFVTLGDPSVYSTYMYVHRLVRELGGQAKLIPGITSFCAVASALGTSLCDDGTPLHIIPASYDGTDEALNLPGTKVLMKSGKQLHGVLNLLKEKNMLQNARMVTCAGMENERIFENLDGEMPDAGYFTTILVKENRI